MCMIKEKIFEEYDLIKKRLEDMKLTNDTLVSEFNGFSPDEVKYSNMPIDNVVCPFGIYNPTLILSITYPSMKKVHEINLRKNSKSYTVYYLKDSKVRYYYNVRNGDYQRVFKIINEKDEMIAVEFSVKDQKEAFKPQVFYRAIFKESQFIRIEEIWTSVLSYESEEYFYDNQQNVKVFITRLGQYHAIRQYEMTLSKKNNFENKRTIILEFLEEKDYRSRKLKPTVNIEEYKKILNYAIPDYI